MKKIKQWFVGLLIGLYGTTIVSCFVSVAVFFARMTNSVGKEFIGNFIAFVVFLVLSVFMPYICFKQMQDGVREELK